MCTLQNDKLDEFIKSFQNHSFHDMIIHTQNNHKQRH